VIALDRIERWPYRTVTLSNVDVFSCVTSWLVTISPMSAVDYIVTLVLPATVQLLPSAET
jgi:hypothetical protein